MSDNTVRTAILVVSDSRSGGEKDDACIPAITDFLEPNGFTVVKSAIVPDELPEIKATLAEWGGLEGIDLILTSGGTGISPRDVTPEATRPLLARELPGIPEAMRAASLQKTPMAVVSRARAGILGDKLVVNLPGSPKAAVENLEPVHKSFAHIIKKARGDSTPCA